MARWVKAHELIRMFKRLVTPTAADAVAVGDLFISTATSPPKLYIADSATPTFTELGSGGGGGAPTDATYITQTANGSLSAEQVLGDLATGILKNTTTTGVLSIAAAATDYVAPVTTITVAGTTNQITSSAGAQSLAANRTWTLSLPKAVILPADASGPSSIALSEDTDNGSNTVTIIAPTSIASDKTVTLQDITGTVYVSSGTDVAITDGGTGQSTATLGIEALVGGAALTSTTVAVGDLVLVQDISASNVLRSVTTQAIADLSAAVTVANEATDTTCFPGFFTAATGQLGPKTNASLTFNSNTVNLGCTTFTGALVGNASTATTLATPRTIGGTSFNGSANIVPDTINSVNEATDTTCFPLFITASGTQALQPKNNTTLTFNSNTSVLSATTVSATTLTGTLSTASQTNITGVGTITTGTWNATDVAVADGGTGRSTSTAYAVICGGTTNTAAQQSIASVGTSGQLLTSNGAGALPTFQTATAAAFDPTTTFQIYEDFYNPNDTSLTMGVYGWQTNLSGSGTLAVNSASSLSNRRPGQIICGTGTTTSGLASISLYSGGVGNLVGVGVTSVIMNILTDSALSDGTNTYTIFAGLGNTTDGTTFTNGIFVSYTHGVNSGKWLGTCRASSTSSTLDLGTAVATDTWYTLRMDINAAASSVTFYVNGSSIGSINTNIPSSASGAPIFGIKKSAGTTDRFAYIDFFYLNTALTSTRYT